jgi:transcriptional regulator GlxA family with amidase domain
MGDVVRHLTLVAGMVSRLADVTVRCGVDRLALLRDDFEPESVRLPTPRTGRIERTLQRRLQAEGTTLQGILEETRRSIALGYLAHRRFAAYEVSFMLGYSEPATFFRAFERWTGQTPQQYRTTVMSA